MKKILKTALIAGAVGGMLVTQMPTIAFASNLGQQIKEWRESQEKKHDEKSGEAIIMYKQSTQEQNSKNKLKANSFLKGLTVEDTVKFEDVKESSISAMATKSSKNTDLVISLVKSDDYTTEQLVDKLSKEDAIISVQKNYKVKASSITNDTYEKYQWAIENNGQNGGTSGLDINPEAVTSKIDKEKVIAIIDTGMDYKDPELADCVWSNPYASKNLLAGEHGYDFINEDADPIDDNGHGTHVAGIIAGKSNNSKGITGAVLDKSNIKIMPLKFLDEEGYGDSFGAISAYNYIYKAQQLGVDVVAVNNSWGGGIEENDEILNTAIDLVGEGKDSDGKGAISICASGNESTNTDKEFNSPSCLDSDYIISVAASNEKDEITNFSNYGSDTVDVAAPGANILSTVSYNCFNPSIYENKTNLCSKYESFDSGLGDFKYRVSEGTVTASSKNFFGNSGKCLSWNFDAEKDKQYAFAIPCDTDTSNQHISEMLKVVAPDGSNTEEGISGEYVVVYDTNNFNDIDLANYNVDMFFSDMITMGGAPENYWTHVEAKNKVGGTLIFLYYSYVDGNVSVNIDDYAISNKNAKEEDFEKYDFYNGTSMATPYVTASVGISANYNETETAIERKARILGSVRKSDNLKNKVKTSGIIDLSRVAKPSPSIISASINEDGLITIKATNFGNNPKVYINGSSVTPTIEDSSTLTITNKDLANTTVEISITNERNETATDSFYLSYGVEYDREGTVYGVESIDRLSIDGRSLYVYSAKTGELKRLNKEPDTDEIYPETIAELSKDSLNELLGKQGIFVTNPNQAEASDFVFIDNKVYTLFTFNYGYSVDRVLAYHDLYEGNTDWEKVTDLPKGYNNSMVTLAGYNGKLYLIGGYDDNNNTISKKMYELNIENKKWTEKTDLPEGRFASKATQVGDNLIVSFGGKEDGKVPNILIYNGSTWKSSSASIDVKKSADKYKEKQYYSLGTGLLEAGLIFSGVKTERCGDTFYYDIKSDKFEPYYYVLPDEEYNSGISIGDKYYTLKMDSSEYASEANLISIPIKTGFAKLTVEYPSAGGSIITNAETQGTEAVSGNNFRDTYYYLPGQKVDLSVSLDNGYYIKSFKVDGKTIKGEEFTDIITLNKKVILTLGRYKDCIKLDKTSATMSPFSTLKLKATLNEDASKNVKWTSSNNNYATVSSSGVVNPQADGNGKKVTITAETTVNGKKVNAKCTINIKSPKIANLKVTKTEVSAISLKWDKVKECEGYEIYIYNPSSKKYKLYKAQKENSIKITKLKSGTEYKIQVAAYKTLSKKKCYTPRKGITKVTQLAVPKLNKLSLNKKAIKVQWNKVYGATGYEIYCSTSKNGKYSKKATVKKQSTTTQNIKGLKLGKKYFVKMRAYKVYKGKKMYSNYSAVKNIKLNK